ncbi:hypothetical protein BFJ68_g4164 [Fusarium oxysporum]|uniref:F-box domain-containing protein n=1 Tax=Fusarium oxysporum TaxID=5507 RepID=A0A420RLH7_FUSOX|nr:hypothetical protein BFJ68_g4164 [Fusarium oxysporum]
MVALPNEVLHQIFAELEDRLPLERWHMYGAYLDHQGSATLRNLCLVCRQFRHIAQPLLYRTVITEGRDSARTVETLLLKTQNGRIGGSCKERDHSVSVEEFEPSTCPKTLHEGKSSYVLWLCCSHHSMYASCAGCRLHYRRPGSPVLLAVEYKDGYEKATIRLPDEYRKLLDQYETEDSENADCIINLDDFGNVLRKFGQNLEEVDFNTFFYDSYSADYLCRSPISEIIGSLRELKSLRHLKLSKEALIGGSESLLRLSDVLPESIETLYLHCGKVYELEDWVEFERELYKQEVYKLLLDGMPNLREIRMERYVDWHEFDYCNPEELDYFRSEYIYPKEAEWPAELHVNGWDVDIVEARLYEIRGRPACNRNIITLSRKT